MAPSRGFTMLLRPAIRAQSMGRLISSFSKLATDPSRKSQVYISRSSNPYLNLSIEHYLLQKSPPDSTVLFLYTNKPCIVLGRNQNPWVEVNLGLLEKGPSINGKAEIGPVCLVRRRSGGGTVFHDEGNVNYSVICPTAAFDRDIHAQMVVRALQGLGVKEAIVNERHDIVLAPKAHPIPHSTVEESGTSALQLTPPKPLKVSGSAYKLTRLRSLHHGTCLLSSPNISNISQYLRSPAKPFILARGVDSVNSPITNVNVSNKKFEDAVVSEFGKMYQSTEVTIVSEEALEISEISKGFAELSSPEWTYLQTPQFTFSSRKTVDDPRERPGLPAYLPADVSVNFTARNGAITETNLSSDLEGSQIHSIKDWTEVLPDSAKEISAWLNSLFGK